MSSAKGGGKGGDKSIRPPGQLSLAQMFKAMPRGGGGGGGGGEGAAAASSKPTADAATTDSSNSGGARTSASARAAAPAAAGGADRYVKDHSVDLAKLRSRIVHRTDKSKFELRLSDSKDVATLEYSYALRDDTTVLDLTHTVVPQAAQGRGIAGLLVTEAFEFARQERIRVRPSCTYIHTFIQKNPQWKSQLEDPDVVAPPRGGGDGGRGHHRQDRQQANQGGGGGGGKTFQKQPHRNNNGQGAAAAAGDSALSAHPWQRRGGEGAAASSHAASLAPPHSVDGDSASHSGSKRRSPLRFDEDIEMDPGSASAAKAAKRGRVDAEGASTARGPGQQPAAAAASAAAAAMAATATPATAAPAASARPVQHIPPAHVPLPCNPQFAKRWALTLSVIADALGESAASASSSAVAAASSAAPTPGSISAAVDALRRLSLSKRDLDVRCLGMQTFFDVWIEDASMREQYVSLTVPFLLRQVRAMPATFDVNDPAHPHLRGMPYACLPTLRTDKEATLHLSKRQLLCLLACSFFGLHVEHIPRRDANTGRELQRFKSANFDGLWLSIGRHAQLARGTNDTPEEMRGATHPEAEKMKCLFAYFESMRARVEHAEDQAHPQRDTCARIMNGIVSFHRKVVKLKRSDIELRMIGAAGVQALRIKSGGQAAAAAAAPPVSAAGEGVSASLPLCPIELHPSGTIEDDGYGMLQIDFANRFLGGGVLTRGCVQEEIRMTICPESLAGLLFVEVMEEHESVTILGLERFANYTGYSSSFAYAGVHNDPTPVDPLLNRMKTVLVAVDAVAFRNKNLQYKRDVILREILKAYSGFALEDSALGVRGGNDNEQAEREAVANGALTSYLLEGTPSAAVTDVPYTFQDIATGNWGCGAFGAEVPLKCMIQLLAATLCHRRIRYFTFGSPSCDPLPDLLDLLQRRRVSVKELYTSVLMNYHPLKQRGRSTTQYVQDLLDGSDERKREDMDAELARNKRNAMADAAQRRMQQQQQQQAGQAKPGLVRAAGAAAAAAAAAGPNLAGDSEDPIEDPEAVDADSTMGLGEAEGEVPDGYDSELEREIAAAAEEDEQA